MSVLCEFTIFPTHVGAEVSAEVSKVIECIRSSGITYQVTSMSTIIETDELPEALDLLNKCHNVLAPDAERIHLSAKFDIRPGKNNRMQAKLDTVENLIGKINR